MYILTSVWVLHTAMPFSFFCSKNKKQRKRRKRRKRRKFWQKTVFLLPPKHWQRVLFPNKTALQPVSRTCGTTPLVFFNIFLTPFCTVFKLFENDLFLKPFNKTQEFVPQVLKRVVKLYCSSSFTFFM